VQEPVHLLGLSRGHADAVRDSILSVFVLLQNGLEHMEGTLTSLDGEGTSHDLENGAHEEARAGQVHRDGLAVEVDEPELRETRNAEREDDVTNDVQNSEQDQDVGRVLQDLARALDCLLVFGGIKGRSHWGKRHPSISNWSRLRSDDIWLSNGTAARVVDVGDERVWIAVGVNLLCT